MLLLCVVVESFGGVGGCRLDGGDGFQLDLYAFDGDGSCGGGAFRSIVIIIIIISAAIINHNFRIFVPPHSSSLSPPPFSFLFVILSSAQTG